MSIGDFPSVDPVSYGTRKIGFFGASIDDRDELADTRVDVLDVLDVLENGLRRARNQRRVSLGDISMRERGEIARAHTEDVRRADGDEIEGGLLLVDEGPCRSLSESFAGCEEF